MIDNLKYLFNHQMNLTWGGFFPVLQVRLVVIFVSFCHQKYRSSVKASNEMKPNIFT